MTSLIWRNKVKADRQTDSGSERSWTGGRQIYHFVVNKWREKTQDVRDETKFWPQRSRPTFPGRPLPSNYDCAVSVEFLSSRSDIFTLKICHKTFLSTSRKWVHLTTRLRVFSPRFELLLVFCLPALPLLFVLRTTATRQTGAPTCPAAHIDTLDAAFGIVTRGDVAAILRRGILTGITSVLHLGTSFTLTVHKKLSKLQWNRLNKWFMNNTACFPQLHVQWLSDKC